MPTPLQHPPLVPEGADVRPHGDLAREQPNAFRAHRPVSDATRLGRMILKRGVTAGAVCAATGIYPRTMTEYLAGRKTPLPSTYLLLADALECQVDELMELPPGAGRLVVREVSST